jgi:hypothetical protein
VLGAFAKTVVFGYWGATEIRETEGIIEDRIESVIPASLCAFSLGVNLFDLHI